MLTSKQKEAVKAVLYYQPTDKELIEYTGYSRIRDNRKAYKDGKASNYAVYVMLYKIDKICDITDEAPEIMDIIKKIPTGVKLALNSGVTPAAVSIAKKLNSYGYKYYLRSYHIEQITLLVEA